MEPGSIPLPRLGRPWPGLAVEVWPRTARAICPAWRRSDLPPGGGQPVVAVHLHDPFPSSGERPGQGCAGRASTFNADRCYLAMPVYPGQERLVAMIGRRELPRGRTAVPPCHRWPLRSEWGATGESPGVVALSCRGVPGFPRPGGRSREASCSGLARRV